MNIVFFIQAVNPWLNVDCSSTLSGPAKTRSITSKKIDINYSNNNMNTIHPQNMTSFIDSSLVRINRRILSLN